MDEFCSKFHVIHGTVGEMCKICIIRCNFTEKSKILPVNFEDGGTQECSVKPFCFSRWTETFCCEASLPFLGNGVWGLWPNFDIFTHVLAWVCFFFVYFIYNSFPEIKKSCYNKDTFSFKKKYTDSL